MITEKDIGKKVLNLRKEYTLKDVYEDEFCRLEYDKITVFCHISSVKIAK